ncbi:3-carboxy-cis,cis-muconate cycloisomerase [Salipiger mangrovisoli]|uniref:3-carboxy-cis,cis-muconate cycloisomerase n=1 Tax=Salipiger mangrovisoli TaxID=2865933 RepID=A0ABR9X0M2_9RHOB|nr:3-carboxy-cis,cis-muconate cycloisomerase [Salipiger mangrovisoli]MBE9637097.1 3-carboxy-cis,cis-muconate cycloisomerase [Salipiger mangrovisoli]
MSASVFDHPWLGGLFGDPEMAEIWSAERQMAHMLAFEAAWSRALGACGRVDAEIAEAAAAAIAAARIDLGDIRAGMAQDGVPVPRLVKQLQAIVGPEAVAAVHKGATSQDVVDSALVLTLKETTGLLAFRITELESALIDLDARQGEAPLMGRTRMQAATEITVSDRLRPWHQPLAAHLERLAEIARHVERVQVGGASGDRKALGADAQEITDQVAESLGLASTGSAWHAKRDAVAEYAGLLSLITGTLGKIGQDICLMAQQGLDEIKLSGGGGSSAMPHKQNPVGAELLVTLARFNAVQLSGMHQALIHEQERSGAAWALEWMLLPQMAQATARALSTAQGLVGNIARIGAPG